MFVQKELNMDNDQKMMVKQYFKFCAVIYGMYLAFLVILTKGADIVEWLCDLKTGIVSRFRRDRDEEEDI